MCAILGILDITGDHRVLRERALRLSRLQRHRGPDWSGVFSCERAVLVHERLAIVDTANGAQPLTSHCGRYVLAVNGEIYNHRELRDAMPDEHFLTASDCEVILGLYRRRGPAFLDELSGMFAFILYDRETGDWMVARDHMGIVPLYWGRDREGHLHIASEMKSLVPACTSVHEFPPGHYWVSSEEQPKPYYERSWRSYDDVIAGPADPAGLRPALEAAVRRHLMSDVPYGVLLSGGLDSSIIAACAARFASRRIEDAGKTEAWWPRLHTFAIGLDDSPDLSAARLVAEHIGSVHHEFRYTIQEGIDALAEVVHHLETYDVTTIRAATPMYLMARRIRAMGVKMVLSGEGSDEIFGGYLYFHRAPDARSLHVETIRKLDRLHLYDCLRANKAMAAWGVEARVPFLEKEFLDVAMRIDPAAKLSRGGRIEKQLLRDAFADSLPRVIVQRQKEQFSDGVGYGWIDALRALAEREVSDRDLATASFRFPHNTPQTKEALMYRRMFEERFPLASCADVVPGGASVACSTPEALAWDASLAAVTDPSGRAVRGVHVAAYQSV